MRALRLGFLRILAFRGILIAGACCTVNADTKLRWLKFFNLVRQFSASRKLHWPRRKLRDERNIRFLDRHLLFHQFGRIDRT